MKKLYFIFSIVIIIVQNTFAQSSFTLRISAYLEGALIYNTETSSQGVPLMRDELRFNPLTEKSYLPVQTPYKFPTQNFDITSHYSHSGVQNPDYDIITDPEQVFGVTGENAIVDWVFVELRDPNDYKSKIASRSALIQRDGDIVDVDGVSNVLFEDVSHPTFYVVLRHRNHLGIMSGIVNKSSHIDFRSLSTRIFDLSTSKYQNIDYSGLATNNYILNGYRALWAGDVNSDGKIKLGNPNDDLNEIFSDVLNHKENIASISNFNFAFGYFQSDIDMNGKSKIENPFNDTSHLYGQVLFYPKNVNILTNYNFVIEQLPSR